MKKLTIGTIGLAALLAGCEAKPATRDLSEKYETASTNRPIIEHPTSITGIPISTSMIYDRGHGRISIVLDKKGSPVLASAGCYGLNECTNAEALAKSKIPGTTTSGEITLEGNYKKGVFEISSLIADNYRTDFKQ